MKQIISGLLMMLLASVVQAGTVEVVKVVAECLNSLCDFSVTLQHEDVDWDHYADRWEIVSMDDEVLATRTLHHPRVKEQPFTTYLFQVELPPELGAVHVRAHDSKHGYGHSELLVRLRTDEN